MVVPHQAGTTRKAARAARLPPHEKLTARIARGLEPALVDHAPVRIASLQAGDDRSFPVRVAGPAALLTAKAVKIGERLAQIDRQPDRLKQKDALDAFRILQAIDTHVLVHGFRSHQTDPHAAAVSAEALNLYREHGSNPQGRFATLAAAAAPADPTVAQSFAVLVANLLDALGTGTGSG